MIALTLGQSGYLYVTLNEKRTLTDGYYLFVFENVTTRDVVNKIFAFSEDESDYSDRYNKFPITVNDLFSGELPGQWVYSVYEQASNSNTDPSGLTEVENGIMKLNPSTEFEFENYTETTSFKAYNG